MPRNIRIHTVPKAVWFALGLLAMSVSQEVSARTGSPGIATVVGASVTGGLPPPPQPARPQPGGPVLPAAVFQSPLAQLEAERVVRRVRPGARRRPTHAEGPPPGSLLAFAPDLGPWRPAETAATTPPEPTPAPPQPQADVSAPATSPAAPKPQDPAPPPAAPDLPPMVMAPAPAAAPLPTAVTRDTDPTMACPFGRCRNGRWGRSGLPSLSTKVGKGVLQLNMYADVGYAFGPQRKHRYVDYISGEEVEDFGRRDFTSYPLYVNQFSLAYAYVQGQYELPEKLRLRFSLHTGHIVESLYFEEKKSLQLIREATLYYYFIPQLAVEGGIFPSYYGAEIVLNKENIHATRAYIADFTPDYEAGARLHIHFRKDMTLRLMVLNGWQEIRDFNGRKGYGLVWSINRPGKIVGDWNMYWGNEAPPGEKRPIFRHYQNLYYRIWLGKRWLIFPMFDLIIQTNTPESNTPGPLQFVVSPAFSLRYGITDRLGVALRWDYLYNKADIVPELKTNTPNGWQSHSGTATLEYLPLPQLTFRLEGRYGTNKDAVFRNRLNALVREDWYVIISAAFHI